MHLCGCGLVGGPSALSLFAHFVLAAGQGVYYLGCNSLILPLSQAHTLTSQGRPETWPDHDSVPVLLLYSGCKSVYTEWLLCARLCNKPMKHTRSVHTLAACSHYSAASVEMGSPSRAPHSLQDPSYNEICAATHKGRLRTFRHPAPASPGCVPPTYHHHPIITALTTTNSTPTTQHSPASVQRLRCRLPAPGCRR